MKLKFLSQVDSGHIFFRKVLDEALIWTDFSVSNGTENLKSVNLNFSSIRTVARLSKWG